MGKTIGTQLNDIKQRIAAIESEMSSPEWEHQPLRHQKELNHQLEALSAQLKERELGRVIMPSSERVTSWMSAEIDLGLTLVTFGGKYDFESVNMDITQARVLRDYLNSANLDG